MRRLIIVLICIFSVACPVFAETASYQLYDDNMSVELPEGWYINTPKKIDEGFIEKSENSASKIKKYLSNQKIQYNLVSPDLLNEINIIVLQNSNSKLLFDFNSLPEESLVAQGEELIKNDDAEVLSKYYNYEIIHSDPCVFIYLEGEREEGGIKSQLRQYSTFFNGFSITTALRSEEGADIAQAKKMLEDITTSISFKEIYELDRKGAMISEFGPAILLVLVIAGLIVYGIIIYRKKDSDQTK